MNKTVKNKYQKLTLYGLGFLAIAAIAIWIAVAQKPQADTNLTPQKSSQVEGSKLKVTFFDVGQGDSALVQTAKNYKILIDGGPDDGVMQKLGENLPYYDHKIDLIILSHPHADHVAGLVDVLKKYDVGQILITGVSTTTPSYLAFLQEVRDKKIPAKIAFESQDFPLADGTDIKILWPRNNVSGKVIENINDSSIVCKITYLTHSILFAGDFEKDAQSELYSQELKNLKADILKVPHHGSSNGVSVKFLTAISPQYAVISVGANNRYGHPARSTLDLLQQFHILIFRTDQNGDTTAIINSSGVNISAQR